MCQLGTFADSKIIYAFLLSGTLALIAYLIIFSYTIVEAYTTYLAVWSAYHPPKIVTLFTLGHFSTEIRSERLSATFALVNATQKNWLSWSRRLLRQVDLDSKLALDRPHFRIQGLVSLLRHWEHSSRPVRLSKVFSYLFSNLLAK